MRLIILSVVMLYSTGACTFEEPRDLEANDIMDMTFDHDSLLADGNERTTITLTFEDGTSAGKKITLTTSHGELDPTASSPEARRRIELTTDGRGELSHWLRAGRIPGIVTVTATIENGPALAKTLTFGVATPTRLAGAASLLTFISGGAFKTTYDVALLREPRPAIGAG